MSEKGQEVRVISAWWYLTIILCSNTGLLWSSIDAHEQHSCALLLVGKGVVRQMCGWHATKSKVFSSVLNRVVKLVVAWAQRLYLPRQIDPLKTFCVASLNIPLYQSYKISLPPFKFIFPESCKAVECSVSCIHPETFACAANVVWAIFLKEYREDLLTS